MISSILKKQMKTALSNNFTLSRPLMVLPRRFEGSYPWFNSMAEVIPKENHRVVDDFLDETEVITRIMFVLH